MDHFTLPKITTYRVLGLLAGFFLFLVAAHLARAVFVSAPQIPILTGDITTTEILNGTIIDLDVSSSTAIGLSKIGIGGQSTAIPFLNGGQLNASSSLLSYTPSTATLLTGNFTATGTTRFNGVTYTWPSADGSNAQVVQTNGSGVLSWVTNGAGFLPLSATARETLLANTPVIVSTSTVAATNQNCGGNASSDNFGVATGNTSVATLLFFPSGTNLTGVTLRLKKAGTPTDNVIVGISTTSSALIPTLTYIATSSVAGTSLTTSFASTTFTFNRNVYAAATTTYSLLLSRDSSLSDANYYTEQVNGAACAGNANYKNWSGSAWSGLAQDSFQLLLSSTAVASGDVMAAYGDNFDLASSTIGWTNASITSGSSGTVVISGIGAGFTGLTAGAQYYLANRPYGGFSTTAGTGGVSLGRAVTSTTMKAWHTLFTQN